MDHHKRGAPVEQRNDNDCSMSIVRDVGNHVDTAATARIPTTSNNDDNSFLPGAEVSSQQQQQQDDSTFTQATLPESEEGRLIQRQVSLSDDDDEYYQDDESQSASYDDDDLLSYDSLESYESESEQDEEQTQDAVERRHSSVIAIGIPAPATHEEKEVNDEHVSEQQQEEEAVRPARFKTGDEVEQEAVSEAIAQGVAEAEHVRKHKAKGDSSHHKLILRKKSTSLKSTYSDGDLKQQASLRSQESVDMKRRASLYSLDDAVARKQRQVDRNTLTSADAEKTLDTGGSIVHGTRRTREGLIDDEREDDDEDLEAQAGIPVVMPGAFAMEGMDAAPGRQITGYDSGFDNSDSESEVDVEQLLRRESLRHQLSVEPEAPPLELEGELHQEPELVDGLALNEDEIPLEEIKVPMKVRLVQASIFCGTLVAIGVIVGLVVALSGSNSSDVSEYTLIGWDAVGESLVATQTDRDGSYFGSAVSLSSDGSRLAVVSPGCDDTRSTSLRDIGQVLVYDWNGMKWKLIGQELNGPGPRTTTTGSLSLSQTVALSKDGRRVAFGSPDWNGGQVAVLQESSTEEGKWTLVGQNITGEEGENGRFGYSVAMSSTGAAVAVGAPFAENANGESAAGIVRVYQETENSTWTQLGQELIGEGSFELNGVSVAISSDASCLAVGSPGSGVAGNFTGAVRVFGLAETVWTQLGDTMRGDSIQDKFGHSVSLSDDGTVLAVGGWEKSDVNIGGIYVGHVRVYKYVDEMSDWIQLGSDLVGSDSYDNFGYSVALSAHGMKVAVGSPRTNSILGGFAPRGYIEVFDFDGNEWRKQGGTIRSTRDFKNLGHSVAISANSSRVAGGAPGAGFDRKYNNVGKVEVVQQAT